MEIAVQSMTTYEEAVTLATWVESEGLAGFTVADHYLGLKDDHPVLDQLTLLGGVAAVTKHVELSTLVSPITFRHPAVMLKAAVTLDQISQGRFGLGVGTGWLEREHDVFGFDFPSVNDRFERLEEALAYLRAALDPQAPGFEGRHYRLESGLPVRPLPRRLRIIVGGTGPERTPSLAGRFADELNVFPDARGDEAERIGICREAAAAAGRDPAGILYSTAFPPVVGMSDDEFQNRVNAVASARGVERADLERRYSELHIPIGTPDRVAEGLRRLGEAGVSRIYLQVSGQSLDDVARSVEVFREALTR